MIAPKYNKRKLVFIKKIGEIYLFEDPKTKIKTTFTLQQLAEFNKKAKKGLVNRNIKNNVFYKEKIEKNKNTKVAIKSKGEQIYEYLKKHPNKLATEIAEALKLTNHNQASSYITNFNKKYKEKGRYIAHKKTNIKKNNQTYKRNIYFVEEI